MGINAITGIGHGDKAEELKKLKKQNPIQETYNQASAFVNMLRRDPAMIGNILTGSQTAATNQ